MQIACSRVTGSVTMVIELSHIDNHQPNTISNHNINPNPNPVTKQHAIVNIQLNVVTCATYPEKLIRDNVVASFVLLSIVTVRLPKSQHIRKTTCSIAFASAESSSW